MWSMLWSYDCPPSIYAQFTSVFKNLYPSTQQKPASVMGTSNMVTASYLNSHKYQVVRNPGGAVSCKDAGYPIKQLNGCYGGKNKRRLVTATKQQL